jgi:hypothetical protein
VSQLYYLTQRDPTLVHQLTTAGAASGYGALAGRVSGEPPPRAQMMLAPYRRHTAATFQG